MAQVDKKKRLPKEYPQRRYYIPANVQIHNMPHDFWISLFNKVYDITRLLDANVGNPLCDPLIRVGGTDITHWFDPRTKDPKTYICPKTGNQTYFCPQGEFLHIPDNLETPWWRDEQYVIGALTTRVRKVRIINLLTVPKEQKTADEGVIIDVACEETLAEILDRYLQYNNHAGSYTWKRLGRPLDMELNLDENEIPDESGEFSALHLKPDFYVPAIHLYFNDDQTFA